MVVLLHVMIALASIVATTYGFISPSRRTLHISYALIAATLVSGTYLVAINPAHMVQSCTTGLIYITGMVGGVMRARGRVAAQ